MSESEAKLACAYLFSLECNIEIINPIQDKLCCRTSSQDSIGTDKPAAATKCCHVDCAAAELYWVALF